MLGLLTNVREAVWNREQKLFFLLRRYSEVIHRNSVPCPETEQNLLKFIVKPRGELGLPVGIVNRGSGELKKSPEVW